MKIQNSILLSFTTLALILIGTSFSNAASMPDKYQGWYKCPPNTTLQVKGDKVRCFSPGRTAYKPILQCVRGQRYRRDYIGYLDQCVTRVGRAYLKFPPPCPKNYRLDTRRGTDRCKATTREVHEPPLIRTR